MEYKLTIIAICFVILYTLECLFPYFDNWKHKTRHTVRNVSLILFNTILANIILVPIVIIATSQSAGLFHIVKLPQYAELILTIILIDFITYIMHVLYHKIPFLWNFHKMHHSDTQMDVTSGARFHIGEHIISTLVRSIFYFMFGMNLSYILLYETLFLANVLFQHANVSISEHIDKVYRILFTSPNMHKVHHSVVIAEANSNYTSLFSFWDRIFHTFVIVPNPRKIVYGVKGLEKEQTFFRMIMTPFRKKK